MHALWMVLASIFFASMGVCVKLASTHFTALELVFYRGLVSMVFMAIVVRARGATLSTRVPALHGWRSAVGVISLLAWFYAIAHLPLATAITLNYMSGVWVGLFLIGGSVLYGKGPARQTPLMLTVLALSMAVFSAFMLYDIKRVIDGGETNYISATLAIYLDIYNVFQSLLALLGIFGGDRD